MTERPPTPTMTVDELRSRLASSARAYKDHYDAGRAEFERRNALIVAAIDSGIRPGEVAQLAGISRVRVLRIVAAYG